MRGFNIPLHTGESLIFRNLRSYNSWTQVNDFAKRNNLGQGTHKEIEVHGVKVLVPNLTSESGDAKDLAF